MDDTHVPDPVERDAARALQGVTELQQQFETLMEIMLATGVLRPGHAALIDKLRRRVEVARRAPVELAGFADKYAIEGEPVDCEARLPLCQARCCSFGVSLSRQDIEEGELTWDIGRPYVLARGGDGYCANLGRDDARCQSYQHRPATCRIYSCKDDPRVWLDFEARIPAPMPSNLIPLHRLTAPRDG
jgi:hypothetical protein